MDHLESLGNVNQEQEKSHEGKKPLAKIMKKKPAFLKPKKITGNHLIFKNACIDDAAFILELRTDDIKSRFLSQTATELSKQIAWLERYSNDESQVYFIIQDRNLEPIGTVRLYDKKDASFCWGSWILKSGSPSNYAIESALIVYQYAISLGFNQAHFDVRKGNQSVWKFHERFGAVRVGESEDDFFFEISLDNILKSLKKYAKYLPEDINIAFND